MIACYTDIFYFNRWKRRGGVGRAGVGGVILQGGFSLLEASLVEIKVISVSMGASFG